MKKILNAVISNRPQNILADLYYPNKSNGKLVLFCHGFKGFKDWGAWHLVAERFAEQGFVFVKFNFSHNGIGQKNLREFTRLDLFKENNYSKEIQDVKVVLDWISKQEKIQSLNIQEYNIIGHSRGGGIALYTAATEIEITKIATWASIGNFDRFGSAAVLEEWKEKGVRNFYNGRTKQDMEIGYQFYKDYKKHEKAYDIEKVVKNLSKPLLLIHGTADPAVGFSHAQRMKVWNPKAELLLVENANHVFGAQHPYTKSILPHDLQKVVDETIAFFKA